ncbi:MAG: NUDIX hydrolase [Pseudomonadota bacterium]
MRFSRSSPFKTARCVIRYDNQFMLAVHSSFWARKERRWGLPGGRIERGEDPRDTVRRELEEELDLYHDDYLDLGSFRYKGAQHAVFGADIDYKVTSYDDTELLDLGWYDATTIESMAAAGSLHAGYEWQAVQRYLEMTT